MCSVNEDDYLTGPPEMVVEIARSSRLFDLGAKRTDYERAGVREYIVVTLNPDDVHWHRPPGQEIGADATRAAMGSTVPRSSPACGSTRRRS